jgi:hypothetical protein
VIRSVPSYVIPGTYLENLRFLEDKGGIDSVELLFFIYDDDTKRLLDAEIEGIRSYASRFGFTLHMPDLPLAEHGELIERTADFIRHYVVHPQGEAARCIPTWSSRWGERFLLENTRSLGEFEATWIEAGYPPICCDTGHLLLAGESPARFLSEHADRIAEVHLHGLEKGIDHHGFDGDETWFRETDGFFSAFDGVVNAEVFTYGEAMRIGKALDSLTRP